MTDPDPRTAADDDEDATPHPENRGESARAPAEGADDDRQPGSPAG